MNTRQKDETYIAGTYARFPLTLVSGHGSVVRDEEGKEYIDLGSGIAVNTFGVSDDEWVKAVCTQAATLQHTSNLFYAAPCADLAEMLCHRTGMKKVFFSNSGAEANECAIKAARKFGIETKGKDCCEIITLRNSFHGRTITTLAATGQDVFHWDFAPLTKGFRYVNVGDLATLRSMLEEGRTAAIMVEFIQGEGGVLPLPADFVDGVAALAAEFDVLLIADEVQTGNGRTGALYAYMNYGVQPDIVTTAKGLAGGLPLGATLLGERVQGVFTPGTHGSTFGGNPVACAGALSILSRLDDKMLSSVREKAEYIRTALEGAPGIVRVTGMGLKIGIETKADASKVIDACRERGVIVMKAKNKVRLLPALNIPEELLRKAVGVIRKVCASLSE